MACGQDVRWRRATRNVGDPCFGVVGLKNREGTMSFWTKMKARLEALRKEASADALLREKMLAESREAAEVSPFQPEQEALYCRRYGDGYRPTKVPVERSSVRTSVDTLWDAFRPSPTDMYSGPFALLTTIGGVVDAVTSNVFSDEIDKMSMTDLREAYDEVDNLINTLDTTLAAVNQSLARERQNNIDAYWLERRRTSNTTSQLAEEYLVRKTNRELSEAYLCFSTRRERLAALRARLARKLTRAVLT
jgi:hypothetical protein